MPLLQDILRRDLAEGQYFITGDLTPEVFADDCRQMLCHCLRRLTITCNADPVHDGIVDLYSWHNC